MCNEKKFARESFPFRKAAEEAWRAARNGDAPFETGFSFDQHGHPGKVQLSILPTVDAPTHLSLVSSPSALGTLHVGNRFGESTPSLGDLQSAKLWGKVIYVESRTGLYAVEPDGTVHHLVNEIDWFNKHGKNCPPAAVSYAPELIFLGGHLSSVVGTADG